MYSASTSENIFFVVLFIPQFLPYLILQDLDENLYHLADFYSDKTRTSAGGAING